MATICQGRIVWIEVPDSHGHNKYRRPVIVLNRPDEIESANELYGVVASHTASHICPRPDHYVEVPYHPEGRVRTKLRKPSVACCNWLVPIDKSELAPDQIGGVVPPGVLELIVRKVSELHSNPPE